MITGSTPVRPSEVYPLRDRALRGGSDEVVAAFRVHYRLVGMPKSTHRVTDVMWEHEARNFADLMAKSGMQLVSSPERPGGIERVRGYNSQPYEDAHTKWARERAERVEQERIAEELRKFDAAMAETERLAEEWIFFQCISSDSVASGEIVMKWVAAVNAFAADKQQELIGLWKLIIQRYESAQSDKQAQE